jgi:hypothetical protein
MRGLVLSSGVVPGAFLLNVRRKKRPIKKAL